MRNSGKIVHCANFTKSFFIFSYKLLAPVVNFRTINYSKMNVEEIQAICKAMPSVTEDIKWGHDLVFSIGGKNVFPAR